MFDDLDVPADIKERGDKVGYTQLESGVYSFKLVLAYASVSAGGAKAVNLHLQDTVSGSTLRTTLWVTSGTAKGCKPFYTDKQGNKQYLPGFEQANDLCLLAAATPLSKVTTELKTIMLYSPADKTEVPTEVKVIKELMGADITAGVLQNLVDKNVLNAAGKYVPSGDTRTEVEVDKFFRMKDGLTVTEIKAKVTDAVFIHTWEAANKGKVVDKTAKVAAGATPPPTNGADTSANPFAM